MDIHNEKMKIDGRRKCLCRNYGKHNFHCSVYLSNNKPMSFLN